MTSPYASGGNIAVTADNLQRVQIREAERQTALLKSIRNCVHFIAIVAGLIGVLILISLIAVAAP